MAEDKEESDKDLKPEEREIMRKYMIRIGRSNDKKHMSEIGKKGRAALVHNILERAKRGEEV